MQDVVTQNEEGPVIDEAIQELAPVPTRTQQYDGPEDQQFHIENINFPEDDDQDEPSELQSQHESFLNESSDIDEHSSDMGNTQEGKNVTGGSGSLNDLQGVNGDGSFGDGLDPDGNLDQQSSNEGEVSESEQNLESVENGEEHFEHMHGRRDVVDEEAIFGTNETQHFLFGGVMELGQNQRSTTIQSQEHQEPFLLEGVIANRPTSSPRSMSSSTMSPVSVSPTGNLMHGSIVREEHSETDTVSETSGNSDNGGVIIVAEGPREAPDRSNSEQNELPETVQNACSSEHSEGCEGPTEDPNLEELQENGEQASERDSGNVEVLPDAEQNNAMSNGENQEQGGSGSEEQRGVDVPLDKGGVQNTWETEHEQTDVEQSTQLGHQTTTRSLSPHEGLSSSTKLMIIPNQPATNESEQINVRNISSLMHGDSQISINGDESEGEEGSNKGEAVNHEDGESSERENSEPNGDINVGDRDGENTHSGEEIVSGEGHIEEHTEVTETEETRPEKDSGKDGESKEMPDDGHENVASVGQQSHASQTSSPQLQPSIHSSSTSFTYHVFDFTNDLVLSTLESSLSTLEVSSSSFFDYDSYEDTYFSPFMTSFLPEVFQSSSLLESSYIETRFSKPLTSSDAVSISSDTYIQLSVPHIQISDMPESNLNTVSSTPVSWLLNPIPSSSLSSLSSTPIPSSHSLFDSSSSSPLSEMSPTSLSDVITHSSYSYDFTISQNAVTQSSALLTSTSSTSDSAALSSDSVPGFSTATTENSLVLPTFSSSSMLMDHFPQSESTGKGLSLFMI